MNHDVYNDRGTTIRFSRGEGAIVIVLKPLRDAVKDNDHVYGVVSKLLIFQSLPT